MSTTSSAASSEENLFFAKPRKPRASRAKNKGDIRDYPEYTWKEHYEAGIADSYMGTMLDSYQRGEEFYYCCVIKANNHRCEQRLRMHPHYINELIIDDQKKATNIPFEFWPVCGNHKSKMTNGSMDKVLPPYMKWPDYPFKPPKIRFKSEPNRNLDFRYEGGIKGLKIKSGQHHLTKLITDEQDFIRTDPYGRHEVRKVNLGNTTLSAMIIRNRGFCVRDQWYTQILEENANFRDPFLEAQYYERIVKDNKIKELSYLFHQTPNILESVFNVPTYRLISSYQLTDGNEQSLLDIHYPVPIIEHKVQVELESHIECFDVYLNGSKRDRRMILVDYIYFIQLMEKYKEIGGNQDRFELTYKPSIYYGQWHQADVNEVFDGFLLDTNVINLFEAYSFLISSKIIDIDTLDSVSMFKILLSYMTWYNKYGQSSVASYKLPRFLFPQIRYIVESRRHEIFKGPSRVTLQNQILQYLPEYNYADMSCTTEQLRKFNEKYDNLSCIEQELARRLFYTSVSNRNVDSIADIPIDEILPQSQFLAKMRTYVHVNLGLGIENFSAEIRRIGAEVYQTEARILDSYLYVANVHLEEVAKQHDESKFEDDFMHNFHGGLSDDELDTSSQNSFNFKDMKYAPITTLSSSLSSSHIPSNSSQQAKISSSASAGTNINIPRSDSNESISLPNKKRCFCGSPTPPAEIEVNVRMKYFLTNNLEHNSIGSSQHVLYSSTTPIAKGKSLIKAVGYILSSSGYEGDNIPTEEVMRNAIVDQHDQNMKVKNTSMSMFFFQSGNEDPTTFRAKFISLMRQDPEYKVLLNNHIRRNQGALFIDLDEDREVQIYLSNKEKLDTELTLIDAIPLCNSFHANVIIWECDGISNVQSATRSPYFNYIEGRDTWILLYDRESRSFLIRDV